MLRHRTVPALAIGLGLVLVGCSQFAIKSAYDRAADFTRLHTYAWLPIADAAPADQRVQDRYIDARIRRDVEAGLDAKGYRPAGDGAAPDFFLNYRLATDPATDLRGVVYGPGWWGWPTAEVYTESYDEGTLYIAVVDGQTKRMVWVGAAEARLLPLISIEKRAKRVDDAVQQILARFPPK